MFVHLARQASIGVILRRGPSDWCRVTLWDTRRDKFQGGQWFHGRIYPDRCDISPDGRLFVYFAGKFNPRSEEKGYDRTWTAVSRPPYLTALALWPMGSTWGGEGVFLDNLTVRLGTNMPHWPHHPNHPPGPLRALGFAALKKGDPWHEAGPSFQNGWEAVLAPVQPKHYTSYSAWRRASGKLVLERETAVEMDRPGGTPYHVERYPSRRRSRYTLYRSNGKPAAMFEAQWADWISRAAL